MSKFFQQYGSELLVKIGEQIYISFAALALGICVAVPLGIFLTKVPRIANVVITIASLLQTIPSLALLALMIPIFNVGKLPAIIALFIYSLLPILRNTYIGMNEVDSAIRDAAKGMGMNFFQSIYLVEIPQAIPTIMAGIRLGTVYVISWATLASYIGAGGLGNFIFSGLNLYKPELIIAGTIPITVMAVLADYLLGLLQAKLTPQMRRKIPAENAAELTKEEGELQ